MTSIETLLRASLAQLEGRELEKDARGISIDEAGQALVRIGTAAKRCDIDAALREERLLYLRALRACAAGRPDAQRIASIAINAAELQYDRGE